MKAIEILKWATYIGKDSEYFNLLEIDKSFDFESFFGYNHQPVENGIYFFYYSDCIDENEIRVQKNFNSTEMETFAPTFSIETDFFDKYGGKVFIHFYKIED